MSKITQAALQTFYNSVLAIRVANSSVLIRGLTGFLNTIHPDQQPVCTPVKVQQAWEQLPQMGQALCMEAYCQYRKATKGYRETLSPIQDEAYPSEPIPDHQWKLSSVLLGLTVYVVGEMLVKGIALMNTTMLMASLSIVLMAGVVMYRHMLPSLQWPWKSSCREQATAVLLEGKKLGKAAVPVMQFSTTAMPSGCQVPMSRLQHQPPRP